MSPLSQRSNGFSGSKLGYLGTVQEKEQDRFWTQVINEDVRKNRVELERKKMIKFKQNQDVQRYLKEQM